MKNYALSALFVGSLLVSVSAWAVEPMNACIVNIEVGGSKEIECYEGSNLSALEARCERRKKTFFNAKDYRVEKNKTCPTGHYGVCRGKKPGAVAEYFYAAPSKPPFPPPNVKSLQEHQKEMCESVQNGIWISTSTSQ
ncbi:MAG: hypothetical protein RBR52_06885 [Thiomonas sp.]|uniref:hypothetical protein n=1 Tax=Thiomonas sp. TaxID=2047785 RepID=UPI002A367B88|nr:hypothetical protein [Thiomonas sp.]MDY0330204.1 hypothetical protein [Thiomonas sp.]